MRAHLTRGLVALTSAAVIVTGLPPAPAQAAQPEVAAFNAALDEIESWSNGLAEVGQMAEALPFLGSSPGAIAGLNDVIQKALSEAGSGLSGDMDYDEDIDLGDGRTGHLKAKVTDADPADGDRQLDFDLQISRKVADQSLTIPIDIGVGGAKTSYSSTGGIDATSTVTFSFDLIYVAGPPASVFVKVNGTSIGLASSASIASAAAINSAIGILGLKVVADDGTSLSLSSNLIATLSDPNNDGRWTTDEINAAGSLEDLVDVGFAAPPGSVTGSLHLQSKDANLGGTVALPGVDLTLGFGWSDISNPATVTVTAPEIGEVGAFLNMDLTDLASNIAQLATTLTSIQRTKYTEGSAATGDLDLPFFKGTLADAIPLNESLKAFLDQWTYPIDDPDKAKRGTPKFTSLQDLLEKLNAINSPGDITISGVGFDDATKKFAFKLGIARQAPADGGRRSTGPRRPRRDRVRGLLHIDHGRPTAARAGRRRVGRARASLPATSAAPS